MSEYHGHSHEHDNTPRQAITLIRKEEIAQGTTAFYFERPADFSFTAGQHFTMYLIDPPETDSEGDSRHFSLACSPQDPEIRIATRMRDTAFKRVLSRLPIGGTVNVGTSHGSYVLHSDATKPAVFLVGGIGVTPVLSMVKDATERKLPHQLILLLSNTTPANAPFMRELTELAEKNPYFTFVPTMTDESVSPAWAGERGYIDVAKLRKYVTDIQNAVFYLSGPEVMIVAMRDLLLRLGVVEDNMRTEEFTGY